MAKISKEQVQKINNACSNGWQLDIEYHLFHNEKRLYKHIKLDNENYLEFALTYNYKNQISLHISKYHHEQDTNFASSQGMGKSKILNETPVKRKTADNLISYTNQLDDNKLMEINKDTPVSSGYGLIIESNEF